MWLSLRLTLSALALAALCAAPALAAEPLNAARLGRAIDAYVKPFVDAGQLSGQLIVAQHGKAVVERSYGFANLELRAPVTPETRFCIASITKPMTATIAIQLMTERKFAMHDSIAKWIPDFPKAESIRVEHLIRHRSGIPHRVTSAAEESRPMTAADVVEAAKRATLEFSPGSRSSYSSGGFAVLARVCELASGMSYSELLEKRIFGPLGMTHSAHTDARSILPGRATSYVPGAYGIERAALQDLSYLVGGGSVWSTARDVLLFVEGVATGKLGPGTQLSWVRGGKIDFNGITDGFRAYADWDSTSGVAVVFAGNLQTGAPDQLRQVIAELVAGKTPTTAPLPALRSSPMSADSLRACEGVFDLGNGTKLKFRVSNGTLYANGWVLLPATDGGFFSPRDNGIVTPVAGAGGKIERMDWKQRGTVYPAPRIADLPPGTRFDDES